MLKSNGNTGLVEPTPIDTLKKDLEKLNNLELLDRYAQGIKFCDVTDQPEGEVKRVRDAVLARMVGQQRMAM